MGCPDLEELERHLSGEARRDVGDHVASCPACSERLAEVSENLSALPGLRRVLRNVPPEEEPALPERVGSFTILKEIARGGMGVVYLAEQDRPRRQVALKVLRPGISTGGALRRFELEAEMLARLRHPGIATILEAGVTTLSTEAASERVPYIAMEYVQGERLDRYVETRSLSLAGRLELVARVADAVHHAHVKGLVHRDLKPGNILVESEPDGPGRPKVLDFGVARIADSEGTLHTSTGQILGTLPYMSPEQLSGTPSAVDAASDVYALGVVLFELLTGELPHDLQRVPLAEAARVIRDEEPRSPDELEPRLRGDVTTILLKALEKDPSRRYLSAAEFGADLRRYLGHEPIQARPQSAGYQLRRFAQRNRALVASLAVLALVIVAAAVVSAILALQAQERLVEARRQAEKFRATSRFVEDMLAAASPEDNPGGRDLTVRETLVRAATELDGGSLAGQPEIELGVRSTIGNAFRALGEFGAARTQLERAVELGRALYPRGHADLADALNKQGRAVEEAGAYDEAERLFRESLEMRRVLSGPDSEDIANSLNNLAHCVGEKGDRQQALEIHEEALAMRRRLFGAKHGEIASSLNNIAITHYALRDLARAEELLRESLEMDRELRGERHPNVVTTMGNLALILQELGRLDEAEPLQRRVLELKDEIYGPDHPSVALSRQNLALLLLDRGELDEADGLFVRALAVERDARGPKHPGVANLLGNYGRLFEARGDFDRAEELHAEALEIRREAFGDDHVATLGSRFNLARVARARGDLVRSAGAFSELAADARRVLPEASPALFTILSEFGQCLLDLDRREAALDVLREARTIGVNAGGTQAGFQQLVDLLEELEAEPTGSRSVD